MYVRRVCASASTNCSPTSALRNGTGNTLPQCAARSRGRAEGPCLTSFATGVVVPCTTTYRKSVPCPHTELQAVRRNPARPRSGGSNETRGTRVPLRNCRSLFSLVIQLAPESIRSYTDSGESGFQVRAYTFVRRTGVNRAVTGPALKSRERLLNVSSRAADICTSDSSCRRSARSRQSPSAPPIWTHAYRRRAVLLEP